MESKFRILTITKCQPKDNGGYTRLDVINFGNSIQSKNIKGRLVAPLFIPGHEAFDLIPESFIDCEVTVEMMYVENARNPMKPYLKIKSIKSKNDIVHLV